MCGSTQQCLVVNGRPQCSCRSGLYSEDGVCVRKAAPAMSAAEVRKAVANAAEKARQVQAEALARRAATPLQSDPVQPDGAAAAVAEDVFGK